MQELERRLAAVERALKRWRLASLALAAVMTMVCAMAAAPQRVPDVVRAKKIEIGRADGAGISLQSDGEFATFTMTNRRGKITLMADSESDTPLAVKDSDGRVVAWIGAEPLGGSLNLRGKEGREGVSIDAGFGGSIGLLNKAGKSTVSVTGGDDPDVKIESPTTGKYLRLETTERGFSARVSDSANKKLWERDVPE